ncbi:hypothetical protein CKM354_000612400 [Cercospora kikuchii]|uniref:Uncharacterized protein n=1 Tax=Cercospora kikuchii TaxID=84275 RepID=A0A9P3CLW0_9PEZI|nr:uncharacterized protein CKM354_000612400 [Cercospora kikuchii]GIZ42875.1 hypothetical protein CKM354_000612400 [Cercospora kikuchii]
MDTLKRAEAELAARRANLQRLELEAAEERAAIALLEQLRIRTLPNRLDTLPQELRDQIWGYCVAPGKVFLSKSRVAYDARFDDLYEYEKPHWPLLAVSRTVGQEAAKVLFEQNQIIWSYSISRCLRLVDYETCDANCIQLHTFARKYLRSASMTFDVRAPARGDALESVPCMRADASTRRAPWSSLSVRAHKSKAHKHAYRRTYDEVQDLLANLLEDCKDLKALELDFTNCYCPAGCCRIMYTVMDMFIDGGWRWPARVKILGTKNNRERSVIMESLGRKPENPGQNTVVFEKFVVGREMQDPYYSRSPFWRYLTEEDLDVELGREEMKVERVWTPEEVGEF